MSEKELILHCAPTLAGMKTGSLFGYHYPSVTEMYGHIRRFNAAYRRKGVCAVPLQYRDGRALIYLYRPARLKKDLTARGAGQILGGLDYPCDDHARCVVRLIRRLKEQKTFPHEIGLFLGYPPEDVRGFMENRPNPKCTGVWKVYGDADAAQKTFAKYHKCTATYHRKWAEGRPMEQMIVAG